MCGRYALTLPAEAMREIFDTANLIDSVARYNIAPTQPVIALWAEAGGRMARLARWGLVPHWVKDPRDFPLLVNARAETIAQKPAFRDAAKHNRCILPASGYYEWRKLPDGSKRPYFITRSDGAPMALAALYSNWIGPQGEEVDTVASITVPANQDLVAIHDRMPAILESSEIEAWLDVSGVRFADAQALIAPRPAGVMVAHPVSTRVNSAANEGPDLIEPVSEAKPDRDGKPMNVKNKKSTQLNLF